MTNIIINANRPHKYLYEKATNADCIPGKNTDVAFTVERKNSSAVTSHERMSASVSGVAKRLKFFLDERTCLCSSDIKRF